LAILAAVNFLPGGANEIQDNHQHRRRRGSSSKGGSVPGTGLGLAIVETLARRWGGSAALVNRPDGGARAEVRFPVLPSRVSKRTATRVAT
jgi:two-component system sensor histidine kinase TctE